MKASSALLFALAACATTPQPEPLRYPSLPAQSDTTPNAPGFEPAASLVTLPLPCAPSELAAPNAVDDDCNGSIDDGLFGEGAPSESDVLDQSLVLALSYPAAAALKLTLRGADQQRIDVTPTDCSAERAFCTRRLATHDLPRGQHTLLVDGKALDPAVPAPSLVVSTQSHGKVTTYVAPVAVGAEDQSLGQLALP